VREDKLVPESLRFLSDFPVSDVHPVIRVLDREFACRTDRDIHTHLLFLNLNQPGLDEGTVPYTPYRWDREEVPEMIHPVQSLVRECVAIPPAPNTW